MSPWTLVILEGAHDLLTIRGTLLARGWCQTSEELPEGLVSLEQGRRRAGNLPLTLLANQGVRLALLSVEGVNNVLGKTGARTAMETLDHVSGFGVIVDADLIQPASRLSAFRSAYRGVLPAVDRVEPGRVLEGQPRLGLWVFPDNASLGCLEEVLLRHLEDTRPALLRAARGFVETSAFQEQCELQGSATGKAILGAIGQADAPARALPSAMQEHRRRWFPDGWQPTGPLLEVVHFIEELCALTPPTAPAPG